MLDYVFNHAFELATYASIFMIAFALARIADAGRLLAATVAALPVAIAWVFLNGGTQFLAGLF